MNILVVGKFYADSFAIHIAETLAAEGHEVRRFEPGPHETVLGGRRIQSLSRVYGALYGVTGGVPAVRSRRMRALWGVVERGPLDVAIVCHDFLWPAEVAELKRRSGAAIALWYPDSLASFGRAFFMNASYDALFFKDPYITQTISNFLPSPSFYLPECCNPAVHCPPGGVEDDPAYACDLTTAGNLHSYRVAVFNQLLGYRVKIWGAPPPRWLASNPVSRMYQGRHVVNRDKALAFRGAKIVVNNLLYGEIWGLNARAFETAGIGAFQLLDWRPGLAQLFVDGEELVSFRGMDDLKAKIDHWLPLQDERRAIGEAGMRRAHADHTYALRLRLLLDTLAGRERGFPAPDLRP